MRKLFPIIVAMTIAFVMSACAGITAFTSHDGTAEDIPIMADARDKGSYRGQTIYASSSKFDDVVAFYEKELKATGWTESVGSSESRRGFWSRSYTKDGRTVEVIIVDDRGAAKTTVVINEKKRE